MVINADCIYFGVEIDREELICTGQDTVGTTAWTVQGSTVASRCMKTCAFQQVTWNVEGSVGDEMSGRRGGADGPYPS